MGLRYEGLAGKVKHTFNPVILKGSFEILWLEEITLHELAGTDEIPMSGGEIVEDNGFESTLAQRSYGMTSDVSGAACDQNHDLMTCLK